MEKKLKGLRNFLHRKSILKIQIYALFDNSPLCLFTKYNTILLEYWFLVKKNLSNFVFLPRKLDNPYYHIGHTPMLLTCTRRLFAKLPSFGISEVSQIWSQMSLMLQIIQISLIASTPKLWLSICTFHRPLVAMPASESGEKTLLVRDGMGWGQKRILEKKAFMRTCF